MVIHRSGQDMNRLIEWFNSMGKSNKKYIDNLSEQSILILDSEQLTFIPPEIRLMTRLTNLYLFNNLLTSLPSTIGMLAYLSVLQLDNNKLTYLPPEIGCLTNLRELFLDNNLLQNLPDEIGNLTSIRLLSLYGNRMRMVPPILGKMIIARRDIQLSIGGNYICVPGNFTNWDYCGFIYLLHVHILAKKYYYRWRSIIIDRRGFAKDNHEIYILQDYLACYSYTS